MDAKSIYLVDQFVSVKAGEPYRLFPFGAIRKNGRTIEITPELAKNFKLPHFKPAIKLGSHEDATPAGGHIIGLEVRPDGVYAIPEWNENGTAAMTSGAYRYHSPEIIWEGEILDSVTGLTITAPIIMGDALLHNPALGEAAAFYHVEKNGGNNMSEMTQVPTPLWERFMAWFDNRDQKPEPPPAPAHPVADNFAAELEAERAKVAQYAAKVEQMEAAAAAAERIAQFSAQFKESPAVAGDHELHTILARLPEADAAVLVTKFKALSAQIDEFAATGDAGKDGNGQELTGEKLVDIAAAYAAEHKVDFNTAVAKLAVERPELFEVMK